MLVWMRWGKNKLSESLKGENVMAKRADLEPLIIREWLKRPIGQRTEHDVLQFYGFITKNMPKLLSFRASGDKYQTLKSILHKVIDS